MKFAELPIDHRLKKVLHTHQFDELTDIQAQAIPYALMGKDLLASSKTGSGKTLAYLIPAVHRLLTQRPLSRQDARVLILAPTRELAKQVYREAKWLCAAKSLSCALVVGGENFNDQVKALKRNPQIVVATAGRIADHLEHRSLFLNGLELLVLDEADRMLDLGFKKELQTINKLADHRKRQTMMFSATLDNVELASLTQVLLNAPQRIRIDDGNSQHEDIDQRFFFADGPQHKDNMLTHLLTPDDTNQSIVFVATRQDTERLADMLAKSGIESCALHAELIQSKRSAIMQAFTANQYQVLVTTDVASRGLDLKRVGCVINYDLPKAAEEYVHRIGRTGRAGRKGNAMSFVGPKDWNSYILLSNFLVQSIEVTPLEGFKGKFSGLSTTSKKPQGGRKGNPSKQKSKKKAQQPHKTKRVDTTAGQDVGDMPIKIKRASN
ncbi:DEAD/DEAH box helicase [Aestuariibacter salexigens]|uniref:DEAD/DEAH box helicase n=1 Tax=Aestuariibacter salexigens TaxID=226010 RepID=UPI00040D5591|nr:DEAD/DEAH box helicase [Aestuariibacter salexigens]